MKNTLCMAIIAFLATPFFAQRTTTYHPQLEKHITHSYQENIYLDYPAIEDFSDLSQLINLITLGHGSDFQLSKSQKSFINPERKVLKYTHSIGGIPVEGSGFTIVLEQEPNNMTVGGGTGGPADPGLDPCDLVYSISPYILNVNEVVPPLVNIQEIETILNSPDSIDSVTEVYVNYLNPASATLAYKVNHRKNGHHISWIDVATMQVIQSRTSGMLLDAPVEDYGDANGQVFLTDQTVSGLTSLINSKVITYDFENLSLPDNYDFVKPADYSVDKIPTTGNSQWSIVEAPESVYQAHYVTTELVEAYSTSLDINFEKVHVGANLTGGNAGVPENFFEPSYNEAYILIGSDKNNGNTMAVYDIVGHELGHVVLYELGLSYDTYESRIIHEGISDMLGVYIASKITGQLVWQMGLDVPIGNTIGYDKDLSAPIFASEFRTTMYFSDQFFHGWGQVLGHLLYLLTEGYSDPIFGTIEPLGLDETMALMLDAVLQLGSEATIVELLQKTIELADQEYALCPGGVSVRKAWDKIVAGHNISDPTSRFAILSDAANIYANYNCFEGIVGATTICESDEEIYLCVDGGIPSDIFEWTILHPTGPSFSAHDPSTQTGSMFTGDCIYITGFPTFNYYPQLLTIRLRSSQTNIDEKVRIKIIDCEGDDPTCEEYYAGLGTRSTSETMGTTARIAEDHSLYVQADIVNNKAKPHKAMVYDLSGRLIFHSEVQSLAKATHDGIYLIVYYNTDGTVSIDKQYFSEGQRINID